MKRAGRECRLESVLDILYVIKRSVRSPVPPAGVLKRGRGMGESPHIRCAFGGTVLPPQKSAHLHSCACVCHGDNKRRIKRTLNKYIAHGNNVITSGNHKFGRNAALGHSVHG